MSKRVLVVMVMSAMATLPVVAQEPESTTSGEYYFFAPLNIDDTTPLPARQIDLRLRYDYSTGADDRPGGDPDDDHAVGTTVVWGPCANVEVTLDLPVNLGDSGDADGGINGNADLSVGLLYRILEEQGDWMPSFAISAQARVPTGDESSGVDGELRFILTKHYASDLRSHVNGFLTTVNGDNEPNLRDFQWGVVLGMDGPLCADGAVRWVADYMHRSSEHDGIANMNVLELGAEWTATETFKLGLSTQIGLDDEEDTAAWGMRVNAVYSLNY